MANKVIFNKEKIFIYIPKKTSDFPKTLLQVKELILFNRINYVKFD